MFRLAGRNQLSGNLQVDGGRLRLADGAGSSPAAGISVTVDNAASLRLPARRRISLAARLSWSIGANTSTTTAGVEVSGLHQVVGRVSGTGYFMVDACADLTANADLQARLVIGGSSGHPGTLTIAASDASGIPWWQRSGRGRAAVAAGEASALATPSDAATTVSVALSATASGSASGSGKPLNDSVLAAVAFSAQSPGLPSSPNEAEQSQQDATDASSHSSQGLPPSGFAGISESTNDQSAL